MLGNAGRQPPTFIPRPLGPLLLLAIRPLGTVTMDLNDLKDTVSNLTLYDLKAGFRKAQNGTFCQAHR